MLDLNRIISYQTNTWPSYNEISSQTNLAIADFIKKIYVDSVFGEIRKVTTNFQKCEGVGHIVLISICCAIDSLSAYAYGGDINKNNKVRFTNFISAYFPPIYKSKEENIYYAFRCDSVHGWNLHRSNVIGDSNDVNHLKVNAFDLKEVITLNLYTFFNIAKIE